MEEAERVEKAAKASSEHELAALGTLLDRLSVDQIRYVVARQLHSTDREAAESVDIPANTISKWKAKGFPIDETVLAMALDGLIVAAHVRRKNLARAMLVKVSGLESDDEKIRQTVATELIDWEMGRATQRSEITGKDGQDLTVTLEWGDDGLEVVPVSEEEE